MTEPTHIHTLHPRMRIAAGIAFIILATFVAYLPAIRGGFIWDDDAHVTENPMLRSADGLRLIWTRLGATPQYYPLTHTSFWIEYGLWGQQPTAYHVTNVLLHAVSALLLWRVLHLLDLRAAWLASAIFALHPIEVESVAWVTERKNVLSGAFYLGAMLAYLRASDARSGDESGAALRGLRSAPAWWGYIISLLLFTCAVLSKTVAGTLPAAILLVLWWKWGTIPWRHVVFLLPMFAIALVMGSLTGWMERTYVGAAGPEWEHSPIERVLIAGRAVWFYTYKLVVPANLTFIYPRWEIDARDPRQHLFPLGAIVVIAVLFVLRGRLGRGPLVSALYFLGTLVPALGFVNVYPHRFSYVADHFQYLAGIGLIVLIGEMLVRVSGPRAAWTTLIPIVLGVMTWFQAHMYRDEQTLWETTLRRNPSAWIAHDHLGGILAERDPQSAAGHYAEAIRLNPDHIEGYIGLGNLLLRRGDFDAAQAQYQRAIDARPDKPTPYYGLAGALVAAGDLASAAREYERALIVDPRFVPARLRLVDLYTKLGRGDDAARHHAEAQRQMRELLGR